jgi:hypothetical protein
MSVSTRFTITHIKNICKNALKKSEPTPLGRWKIHKENELNLVVNYSNEDHCGTCAQYIQIKKEEIILNREFIENNKKLNDEYIWILKNTQD